MNTDFVRLAWIRRKGGRPKNVLHVVGREEVKTFTLYPPSTITDGERRPWRARRTIAGVAGPQPVFPAGFMTTFALGCPFINVTSIADSCTAANCMICEERSARAWP
jgi:hypothetical protein